MQYVAYLFLTLFSTTVGYDQTNTESSTIAVSNATKSHDSLDFYHAIDRSGFEDSLHSLYNVINLETNDLSYEVFRYGMIGYYSLRDQGKLGAKNIISIIDFTKPSTQKRFYTIDLNSLKLKFYTYVSHGKNTGENMARVFSNEVHSNQSSLGFYITAETYIGSKGYSLKLDGAEKGYNDNMRDRAVVMHEADYVSESWIKKNGRLGRSQGCPALPKAIAREVIDEIKNQTVIFAYYDNSSYLNSSSYLNLENLLYGSALTAKK